MNKMLLFFWAGVVALLIFIVYYFMIKNKGSGRKNIIFGKDAAQGDANTQSVSEEDPLESLRNDLERQIKELKKGLSDIQTRVIQLERKMAESPRPSNPERPSQNAGGGQAPFRKEVKYVELVGSNGINANNLLDTNSDYALLVINIDSPSHATFKVNDLPQAQRQLLSSYQYSLSNFVNASVKSSTPSRIVTKRPGTLMLRDNQWVPTEKAEIEIVA